MYDRIFIWQLVYKLNILSESHLLRDIVFDIKVALRHKTSTFQEPEL